ncbi:MAG: phosphoenolpyruvate carboxykinase (ATP) [Gammaproteobacteria bacterium RIFCSPLOWO2_12_FULL_38_14]|nr:MAG: phosphoenolpyruvate carboxykinase (ATP) [Gammaproteobacteria bacterium RIFCSPLOWO2_12_FULL_38_14]
MNNLNFGIKQHINLSVEELVAYALQKGEGSLCANGALSVITGKRTGRSPKDRFIVKDEISEKTVDWGERNQAISADVFQQLWEKAKQHLKEKEVFVSHLAVGAHPDYQLPVSVVTEKAWHNLFARHLFIRTLDATHQSQAWLLLNASTLSLAGEKEGVKSEAALVINFSERKVLLCGLNYAGEMKKALFAVLNFLLPAKDVLPMHCAANQGKQGDVALFFGLSGTGKTTLSADPGRYLIGDDEHAWSSTGVFNFEGGCYAKCIDLQQDKEPVIWHAISQGTIMENVVLDPVTLLPDYHDASLTQNTRAVYPRENIELRVESNCGGKPACVIFLTCDLYGVLPPISKLTQAQAAYYFLSGYTAMVASTEVGNTQEVVKPTFSTCFGAPFFPRFPTVYAQLLMKRLQETDASVYLVNTGWTKGSYGEGGERFSIPFTRKIVHAIVDGVAVKADYEVLPGFNFLIPKAIPGVDSLSLDPRKVWKNEEKYQDCQEKLILKFQANFKKFQVDHVVEKAGPQLSTQSIKSI